MSAKIDIAIPTCDRPISLAITLASLLSQSFRHYRLLIADQGELQNLEHQPELQALFRVFKAHGNETRILKNLPKRGIAQQRDFLLRHVEARAVMFLDDDLIIEPWVLAQLVNCLEVERCGFVGHGLIGLSFADDCRPWEQHVELWDGPVESELIEPGGERWNRHRLHNAANLYHLQKRMQLETSAAVRYKVAWIGGCVLYDTEKLMDVGGFSFWRELPAEHCGEDVLAQLRIMARYGGCGILPSGVYHQEVPTLVTNRRVNAPEILPILVEPNSSAEEFK